MPPNNHINSDFAGWSRRFVGSDPLTASDIALDDVGPSREKMLSRGLRLNGGQAERLIRKLEKRERRRERRRWLLTVPVLEFPEPETALTAEVAGDRRRAA